MINTRWWWEWSFRDYGHFYVCVIFLYYANIPEQYVFYAYPFESQVSFKMIQQTPNATTGGKFGESYEVIYKGFCRPMCVESFIRSIPRENILRRVNKQKLFSQSCYLKYVKRKHAILPRYDLGTSIFLQIKVDAFCKSFNFQWSVLVSEMCLRSVFFEWFREMSCRLMKCLISGGCTKIRIVSLL